MKVYTMKDIRAAGFKIGTSDGNTSCESVKCAARHVKQSNTDKECVIQCTNEDNMEKSFHIIEEGTDMKLLEAMINVGVTHT